MCGATTRQGRSSPGRWTNPRPGDCWAVDLAARLGPDNIYGGHPDRYPRVSLEDLTGRRPDVVVLPDEPYPFWAGDGPEMFPGHRVALVEGRSLTWYSPSLVTARAQLLAQLGTARDPLP